jgi:hypothetical protein
MPCIRVNLAACQNHSLFIKRAHILATDVCDIVNFPWRIHDCVDYSARKCSSWCSVSDFGCRLTCNFSSLGDSADIDAQCDEMPHRDCHVTGVDFKSSALHSCSAHCVNNISVPGWAIAMVVVLVLIVVATAIVLCMCGRRTRDTGKWSSPATRSFDLSASVNAGESDYSAPLQQKTASGDGTGGDPSII